MKNIQSQFGHGSRWSALFMCAGLVSITSLTTACVVPSVNGGSSNKRFASTQAISVIPADYQPGVFNPDLIEATGSNGTPISGNTNNGGNVNAPVLTGQQVADMFVSQVEATYAQCNPNPVQTGALFPQLSHSVDTGFYAGTDLYPKLAYTQSRCDGKGNKLARIEDAFYSVQCSWNSFMFLRALQQGLVPDTWEGYRTMMAYNTTGSQGRAAMPFGDRANQFMTDFVNEFIALQDAGVCPRF